MGHSNTVAVIGAGLSGLACAHRLKELGIHPLVLEASSRPGGTIATVRRNGFIFEGGPQFPRFSEPVWKLVQSLGLEDEFIVGDPKLQRYILRDGQLHLAPFSALGLISTRLVSVPSKLRVLSEPFRHSRPPEFEETLEQFVRRKFGAEILDYLVDPLISTIFFGDAAKMGMWSFFPALTEWERTHGSVARGAIRAFRSKQKQRASNSNGASGRSSANAAAIAVTDALPALGSFQSGMSSLPEKLAERLKETLHLAAAVKAVTPGHMIDGSSQTGWRLRMASGEEILAAALVLAVPSHAASPVLDNCVPPLAALLSNIEHAPLGVVSCAYARSQVAHPLKGFGFMVPRQENLRTICTFWNSSVFPQHAPKGMVVMTSYARGTRDRNVAEFSDQELTQAVQSENASILGITESPVDTVVWKYPRALPQYGVGHSQSVTRIRELLAQSPGLFLAGNFLTGRSIGDCAASGFQAAEDVHSYFRASASNVEPVSGVR